MMRRTKVPRKIGNVPNQTRRIARAVGTIGFMAPSIILFFFAQKAFVEGITLTGVKV